MVANAATSSSVAAPVVKERPIIFSGESVRAILKGRKTQTRRVMFGYENGKRWAFLGSITDGEDHRCFHSYWLDEKAGIAYTGSFPVRCRYGKPGDRLWVRETYTSYRFRTNTQPRIVYRADDELHGGVSWCSAMFMPRELSRISLEIVSLRVQVVQWISPDDCEQEGVRYPVAPSTIPGKVKPLIQVSGQYPPLNYLPQGEYGHNELMRAHFASGWDGLNAKRGYSWDMNPWVWAITFRRV